MKSILIIAATSLSLGSFVASADTFKSKTGSQFEIVQKDGKVVNVEPSSSEPIAATKWFTSITYKFAVNGPTGDVEVNSPIAIRLGNQNPSKLETINLVKFEVDGNKRLYCLKASSSDVVPCGENEVVSVKNRSFPIKAADGVYDLALPVELKSGEYGLHAGGEVWTFKVN